MALLATVALLVLYVRGVGGEPGDFEAYYSAAWTARQGGPLYEQALAWRDAGISVSFPGPRPMADRYPGVDQSPFVYPAGFALALLPAILVPEALARDIWFTIIFACMVGTAFVLSAICFHARGPYRLAVPLALAAALALFQPTRASLTSKQVDAALLLMLSLSLLAFSRRQDSRAGAWLALALSVKPFLGILVLFFLWKRAFRATAIAVTLSGAIFLLPALYFGTDVLTDFAAVAMYWSSPSFAVSPMNQSLYGLSLRLFTLNAYTVPLVHAPVVPLAIRAVVTIVTLCLLATFITRSRSLPDRQLALEYGLAIVGMLLIAPLAQDIYYLHLAVPLVAILSLVIASWPWRISTAILAAWTAAAGLYLTLPSLRAVSMAHYAFHQAPVSGLQVLQTGAHVYGLLAVAAASLGAVIWQQRAQSAQRARAYPSSIADDGVLIPEPGAAGDPRAPAASIARS